MARGFWLGASSHFFLFVSLSLITTASADETLRFGDSPIGYVTVSQAVEQQEGFVPELKPWFCRRAVGEVAVPAGGLLGLELIGSKIDDAAVLQRLPPHTSQLKISNAKLGKEHMTKLGQLTKLTSITFEKCQFSEDAFDAPSQFPELRLCRVEFDGYSPAIEQSFSQWLSQQTQLEQLVVMPQMSDDAILRLSELPKLKAIHASLDANAARTLSALSSVRCLELLNVSVTDDCPSHALDIVGELRQLRSYRQVFGSVSAIALTKLGEQGRLEHLDLALVDIAPDAFNAIAGVKSLRGLDLVTRDQSHDGLDNLVSVCSELPRLSFWPRLESVSRDDLTLILSRPNTERLSLTYLDSTLNAGDLAELAKLKNLKELEIEGIPVDDAWLTKMSVLSELEYLDLFDTHVVGHGFAAFAGHKKFRRLGVFVGSYDDAHIDFDLSPLAETNLETLQIMGPFGTESLRGISELKTLRELRLFGDLLGFSDDSIAYELCQLPVLQELSMSGNCFITDVGARELSKMDTLQALMVSGFVTDRGVAELSKIPSLRRLVVSSSKVDSGFSQDMPDTLIRSFNGNVDEQGIADLDDLEIGADGFLRSSKADGLEKIRQLEGHSPPIISVTDFGGGDTFKLDKYREKVVLIDFWGTWCGPCRFQMPKLQALYKEYQPAGLEIVSIHTSNGSENLAEYLAKKDLPWVQLVDRDDSTVERFLVPHYPSLYLIDRGGTLRVALAHPKGLEASVKKLLSEDR